MVACVTSNGYLRLLQYSVGEGILVEDQHKPASSGVTAACLLKKTGHIAIVTPNLVTFFDPLLLEVAATIEIPMPPDGARNSKLQACPSGKLLILGRTDGVILRISLPELNKIDLTLLAVRSGIGGEAVTPGNGNGESQAGGVLCASCGTPNLVLQCTAADGAASGYGSKLHHAWSQQRGLLALVNSRNQAVVIQRNTDGTSSTLLKEQLPEASIVSLSWDPSTQSVLAIAIRHYGIALWDTKSDAGIQMWSGMAYKSGIIPFSKSTRAFDPVFTSWNLAGQLAVGMADGTFAVWDSMSMDISTSQSSGKHKGPISSGDWFSSLFAPALALASKNTIKISQGFEGVEWQGTSLKLKVGAAKSSSGLNVSQKDLMNAVTSPQGAIDATKAMASGTMAGARRLSSGAAGLIGMGSSRDNSSSEDLEGYEFEKLKFSPSGRHIATIARSTQRGGQKQIMIYELQENRSAIMMTRDMIFTDGESPFNITWLLDQSLLVFAKTASGSLTIKTLAPSASSGTYTWPPMGQKLPGTIIDAQASTQGLIAIALCTPEEKGMLMILTCPGMKVAAEMPLDGKPQSIVLYQPKGSYVAYLTIAFEGGGVEAWELPPGGQAVDVS